MIVWFVASYILYSDAFYNSIKNITAYNLNTLALPFFDATMTSCIIINPIDKDSGTQWLNATALHMLLKMMWCLIGKTDDVLVASDKHTSCCSIVSG